MQGTAKDTGSGREKTFRVAISALKTNPAYLTLFCLGLMGGPVIAGAMFTADGEIALVATVSWLIFLLASLLVVAFVESRRNPLVSADQQSLFTPPDQLALSAFEDSHSAAKLSGRWSVHWFEGVGAERRPYSPDPEEIAIVTTRGPTLFIHCYDPSNLSEYWLYGRLSDRLDLPLFYWSKPETNMLTGVVFLSVDESFEAKGNRMSGWWRGRTRDNKMTVGEIELERLGLTQIE